MVERVDRGKSGPQFTSQTCSLCAPRRVNMGSDSDSVGSGYHSISPSPSELALPNVAYSSTVKDEDVDFSSLFGKIEFGSLVVLRESLLPLFHALGLNLEPQLRTLCHNSAEVLVDFAVELREATVFVSETIDYDISRPALFTDPMYAFLAEQFVVNGSLKYTTESSIERSPTLSLLVHDATSEEPNSTLISKLNVTTQCCISFDSIASNITGPLLKLFKHMSKTIKLRTKSRSQRTTAEDPFPLLDEEEPVTPKAVNLGGEYITIEIDEPDSAVPVSPPQQPPLSGSLMFSRSLVQYLMSLQHEAAPPTSHDRESAPVTPQSSSGSVHSTGQANLIRLSRSPRFPRAHTTTASAKPSASLLLPTLEVQSDSSIDVGGGGGEGGGERGRGRNLPSVDSGAGIPIVIDDTDGDIPLCGSPDEHVTGHYMYGEDTSDSQHVGSSDNEVPLSGSSPNQHSSSFIDPGVSDRRDRSRAVTPPRFSSGNTLPLRMALSLGERELLFSVFCLLRVNAIQVNFQVETTRATLEVVSVSGSVDVRKTFSGRRAPGLPSPGLPSPRQEEEAEVQFMVEGGHGGGGECDVC